MKGEGGGGVTWAGGGEHWHGVGVVVPPAKPLNELLLALQDAEACSQRGVEHVLHACRETTQRIG